MLLVECFDFEPADLVVYPIIDIVFILNIMRFGSGQFKLFDILSRCFFNIQTSIYDIFIKPGISFGISFTLPCSSGSAAVECFSQSVFLNFYLPSIVLFHPHSCVSAFHIYHFLSFPSGEFFIIEAAAEG